MPKCITAYRHDAAGYYMGTDKVLAGQIPDDDVLEAPELKEGCWSRYVDGAWTHEKKPQSAGELEGVVVDHQDHSKHAEELRGLMHAMATGTQPGEWRVNQEQGTNNLSVVRIPDKTAAELSLEEAQKADSELSRSIAELKEAYVLAQLAGDEELIEQAKSDYRNLLGI